MLGKRYIKNFTKSSIGIALFSFLGLFDSNAFANVNIENKLVISNDKNIKTSYKRDGSISIPIISDDKSLFFLNMGGNFDNQGAYGMTIGLGARKDLGESEIFGIYGSYDYLSSLRRNNFHQVTTGMEMLFKNWEARLNAYMPVGIVEYGGNLKKFITESQPKVTGDNTGKMFLPGNFSSEAALSGFDIEIGRKVRDKLGLYLGGYYFYKDYYDDLIGPKLRLTWSGEVGEKITIGLSATLQSDFIRGAQFGLGLNIGFSMSDDEGLIHSKIQRETGIMTSVSDHGENPAVGVLLNGRAYYKVNVLASGDLVNEINNIDADALIILDGTQGDFNVSNTITMKPGQALFSGKKENFEFTVGGMKFIDELPYGYSPAKIVAADGFPADTNLLHLANGNIIKGLEFDGSNLSASNTATAAVIMCNNRSWITIDSNTIKTFQEEATNPYVAGIRLNTSSYNTISNNRILVNGDTAIGIQFYTNNGRASFNKVLNNNIEGSNNSIGINYYGAKAIIEENDIIKNTINGGKFGISNSLYQGVDNNGSTLRNNKITENVIDGANIGIRYVGSKCSIEGNIVNGNTITAETNGIRCETNDQTYYKSNSLIGNTINSSGVGLYHNANNNSPIESNIVDGNTITTGGNGIQYETDNESHYKRNTIKGNTINSSGNGLYHHANNKSRIENNLITNNSIAIQNSERNGIYYNLYNFSNYTDNSITGNKILTLGNNSVGIYLNSINSVNNGAEFYRTNISTNQINTSGSNSDGILYIAGWGSELQDNIAKNNLIVTLGNNSSGISYKPGTSTSAVAATKNITSNNVITTYGENGNGIYFGKTANANITQNKFEKNEITINGNADAIHVSGAQDSLIKDNKIALNSEEASAIRFTRNDNTVKSGSTGNSYTTVNDSRINENFCEGATSDGSKVEFTDGTTCPSTTALTE